jgi:hypothetical protein
MEDSHIADLDLGNDRYIFGVFDGHGGFPINISFLTFKVVKFLSMSKGILSKN